MSEKTIKELVLEEGAIVSVLEKYGIDYCCGGNVTLGAACAKKGLDFLAVTRDLDELRHGRPYSFIHCDLWDLDFMVDFIVQNHHRYCKETMPVLMTRLTKLATKHGDRYPHIKQVLMLFQRGTQELETHMRKEEMILFPYVKSLVSAKDLGRLKPLAPFVTAQGPISMMESDHDEVGQIFFKIRALLSDYTAPEGACNTHRSVISGLQEFEQDLHQHIHLENNLLFPRVLRLESELAA